MPGGGGGTDTGRLPGACCGGRPAAAGIGAVGRPASGAGAIGGGAIGSGATGGDVSGWGRAGAFPAAGSGRPRRGRRVPESAGRIGMAAAGSAARRAPADRRPLLSGVVTRAASVPIRDSQALSVARTAPMAWRTASAAAGDSDLLTPPRRGDSLMATTSAVTAAVTWSSVPAPARASSATTSRAVCSTSLPRPPRRPGSGSASSTAMASGCAGSGYARSAAG
jgi:hypothetical protein